MGYLIFEDNNIRITFEEGTVYYYIYGSWGRKDGPAIIRKNGTVSYILHWVRGGLLEDDYFMEIAK